MVLITTGESDKHHSRQPSRRTTAAFNTVAENHHHHHNHMIMESSVDPANSRGSFSNFTSLPCFNVKWGRTLHLRCVKGFRCVKGSNSDHEFSTSLTRSEFNSVDGRRRRRSVEDDDGGIQAMREKLMLDFRRQAAQMQAAILKKSDVVSTVPLSPEVVPRPWNLRTRRAVCKEPINNNSNNYNNINSNVPLSSDRKPSFSPAKIPEVKSPGRRNDVDSTGGGGDGNGNECRRAKFSRSLSKQEIEEDFLAILGTRSFKRIKKRPKTVQKQIDAIFPGFWLSEITADMYKVNEQPKC